MGSLFLIRRLHLTRYCASSPDNSLSDKSFLMLSNHLRFGLPLLLFPGISIAITLLPTHSFSVLNTGASQCMPIPLQPLLIVPSLLTRGKMSETSTYIPALSWIFVPPSLHVPLILSFLILSSMVTPFIHLIFLISTTSNFFSCAFFTFYAQPWRFQLKQLYTVLCFWYDFCILYAHRYCFITWHIFIYSRTWAA